MFNSNEMFIQTSGNSMPQNNVDVDDMITLDDIVFTLQCKGETKLANKFVRNYLKNFAKLYSSEIGLYE